MKWKQVTVNRDVFDQVKRVLFYTTTEQFLPKYVADNS